MMPTCVHHGIRVVHAQRGRTRGYYPGLAYAREAFGLSLSVPCACLRLAVALKTPIPVPEPGDLSKPPADVQLLPLSRGKQSDGLRAETAHVVAGLFDQGRRDSPPLVTLKYRHGVNASRLGSLEHFDRAHGLIVQPRNVVACTT